jgi:hypothetical protein
MPTVSECDIFAGPHDCEQRIFVYYVISLSTVSGNTLHVMPVISDATAPAYKVATQPKI